MKSLSRMEAEKNLLEKGKEKNNFRIGFERKKEKEREEKTKGDTLL